MNSEKIIKTAILGAGAANIATNQHLPGSLAAKNVELAALCDINEGVYDYAQKHSVKAYTDFAEMLKDSDIQMVQIATPDQFHCEHAIMALAADKHVLLQKPPCVSADELNKLREAAEKSKGNLKIILNQRHTNLSRSIKYYIQNDYIGDLREIIIKYRGRRFPVENPNSFYLKKESGGVWLHNSLHWLDEASYYSESIPEDIQVYSTKNENGCVECLGEGPNYWSAVFPMREVTYQFEYNTMLMQDEMPAGMQRVLIGTKGEIRQQYGSSELEYFHVGGEAGKTLPLIEKVEGLEDVIKSFELAINDYAVEIISGKQCEPLIDNTMELFEFLLEGLK